MMTLLVNAAVMMPIMHSEQKSNMGTHLGGGKTKTVYIEPTYSETGWFAVNMGSSMERVRASHVHPRDYIIAKPKP